MDFTQIFFPEENNRLHQLIMIGAIIFCGLLTTRLVRWLLNKFFEKSSSKLKVDATRYKFLKNTVSFIIWMVVSGLIISIFPPLRSLAVTLFAGAGVLVAIIGFAAQKAFSNIIAGIFIVIFKPFRVGDLIKTKSVGGHGIVEDITLRHTVILNFENKRIIIPNSVISSDAIENEHIGQSKVCRWIEVQVSYGSDFEKAMAIMREVVKNNALFIDGRTEQEKHDGIDLVDVRLIAFQDSGMLLRAYAWCENPIEAYLMHSQINIELKKEFDKSKIEIPYPHRTLINKNV